jgi:ABC-2 type transport system permease protein
MRLLRVLRLYQSTSVLAELEYRWNFVLAMLSSFGNLAGSWFGLYLFYRAGAPFPGWSWEQSLLVLGVFTTLTGFVSTILTPNLNRIVMHVQEGTLDFVLLKPIDSQFQVSLRAFSPWGLPDVAFGLGVVAWAAPDAGVTALGALTFAAALACGLVILYALWFAIATTSIWFTKIYNATEVLRGLVDAGRYPLAAYPWVFRFVFTFVVPVAFLTTVPVDALLSRAQPAALAGSCALAIVLFFGARWFWRFALRSYTSASS